MKILISDNISKNKCKRFTTEFFIIKWGDKNIPSIKLLFWSQEIYINSSQAELITSDQAIRKWIEHNKNNSSQSSVPWITKNKLNIFVINFYKTKLKI